MDRARSRGLVETLIMTVLALVGLVGLQIVHVLAPVPIPGLVATVGVGMILAAIVTYTESVRRLLSVGARVGVQVIVTTLVIYATGWGSVLTVGFVYCAAQAVSIEGPDAAWPTAVWSLACMALAEIGIAVGYVPSQLPQGYSHGIAALSAVGLTFVIRVLWASAQDRDAATALLSKSEIRFRRLLTNAADAVVVLDPAGTIVFATEAIETLTGYAVDELVGRRDASAIVQPDDLAWIRAQHRGVLLTDPGATLRADMRVQHRDGSLRWCQISVTNRVDDPNIEGVVVNVHDITERRAAEASVVAAEARFRSLVQHAADGILILDHNARCLWVSPSYERLTGRNGSELVGRFLKTFGHTADLPAVSEAWSQILERPEEMVTVLARVRHKDDWWQWQELSLWNRRDDPTINGIVVNVRDVTERQLLDDVRREESRILEMIAWGDALEIVLGRIASMAMGATQANFCFIRMLDGETLRLVAAPGISREVFEQLSEVGIDERTSSGRAALERRESFTDYGTPRGGKFANAIAPVEVVASWGVPIQLPNLDAVAGTLSLLFDRSDVDRARHRSLLERAVALAAVAIEQSRAREELEHRAFHDELTGLANRGLLNDRLGHALERSRRVGSDVALLYFDLDRFKLVNDSLGHEAGDQLLVEVSRRLRRSSRATDTIARLGGDEFVVVVEDIREREELDAAVERLTGIFGDPFEIQSETIFVSASVGVSVASDIEAVDALREADDAMYRAKRRGRGSVEYETSGDGPSAANRLARVTALHRALERDELVVHYQPIVDLRSRQVIGAEALVRWEHPEFGLVGPHDFIPLAEDSGLIVPLGWHVLTQVVERMRIEPNISVSVNVAARQLSERDFVARLVELTQGLPRDALTLEITESMLIDAPDRVAGTLAGLAEAGIRLSLDDFGTGYSSLSFLSKLPIHELKIDRSFVKGLDERPEYDALVGAIIQLGDSLSLDVIAEGVEAESQAARLQQLGCQMAQGYLFGKPVAWIAPDRVEAARGLG